MRMVSNKHVSGSSMKHFKRVHVLHKMYVAKPKNKVEEKPEPQEIEEAPEIIPDFKPKAQRRKKVADYIENNEEKPEYDG